ncbi:MAG: ornithine cyclodeaminase family protein [Jatrophihabitans sp.]
MTRLPWIDADTIAELLPMSAAIDATEAVLLNGLDPAGEPARGKVDLTNGHLLLMPSESADRVGVKIASVTPGNPAQGLARIQAVYVLFDTETLTPQALLDGAALTALRTPAVSGVAARHLAPARASRLVVFGTGPQARSHIEAMRAVRPIDDLTVIGRSSGRAGQLVGDCVAAGIAAREGYRGDVADADLIVCATSSDDPVFDGSLVRAGACVIACGSHEPQARELDSVLMGRAQVVVEDPATALRETGDVITAVADGALSVGSLVPLVDVVTGRVAVDSTRPTAFSSVGMAWEDLAIAAEVHRRWLATHS